MKTTLKLIGILAVIGLLRMIASNAESRKESQMLDAEKVIENLRRETR